MYKMSPLFFPNKPSKTLFKDPVCFVIDIVTVCIPHFQKIIYVYNYANKTIFKHRRICKMCTENICARYI
jgi:hypothetical protein